MAGSYRDCDHNGMFRFDLLDHMGDAHEACEMMHFMIRHLSGGDEARIKEAEESYYAAARGGTLEEYEYDGDEDEAP